MANEAYRLRSLAFQWDALAGSACDEFHEYKGGRWCFRCDRTDAAHQAKQCAKALRALLAEPELLTVGEPPPAEHLIDHINWDVIWEP